MAGRRSIARGRVVDRAEACANPGPDRTPRGCDERAGAGGVLPPKHCELHPRGLLPGSPVAARLGVLTGPVGPPRRGLRRPSLIHIS